MPDAALDATAEALTRRLLAEIPADRPRGAADIDRLPAPLVPLLHARVAAAVDDAAPTSSAWIDAARIRETTADWRRAALAAAQIPADVWPEALREAVGLALAHLIRPADTLASVAFSGGAPAMPIEDALARARTFGPYPYLPQIAARYADRKNLDLIDRVGLEQLLRRIDRRMVSTFGPDDWTTLLGPLLDLVGPVGSPPGAVPTALLRPLFMTKGVGTLAVELEGTDSVSPDELRALLDRTLVPADAPPQPQVHDPTPAEAPPDARVPDVAPSVEGAPDDRSEAAPPDLPDETTVSPELPPLTAPPLPSVAQGARPPTIGSKYLAPEFDDHDASEVLGPAVPVGSSSAVDEEEAVREPLPADTHETDILDSEPREAEARAEASHEPEALEPATDPTEDDRGEHDDPESYEPEAFEVDRGEPEADHTDAHQADRSLDEPDAMSEVREALTDPLSDPLADAEPEEDAPDLARGSNPLIQPVPPPEAAPARTIADAFVFPDEEPVPDEELPPAATAPPPPDDTSSDGPPRTSLPAFDDEPLWKQLVRERRDDPPTPAPAPMAESVEDDEPLWKQFAKSELAARLPPAEGQEPTASPELDVLEARVLGPESRERRTWYVTELFDGSPSVYHRTLTRIDRSESYTDATDIISSDILRAYSIDPYTESMVAFIDAVQDHFDRR